MHQIQVSAIIFLRRRCKIANSPLAISAFYPLRKRWRIRMVERFQCFKKYSGPRHNSWFQCCTVSLWMNAFYRAHWRLVYFHDFLMFRVNYPNPFGTMMMLHHYFWLINFSLSLCFLLSLHSLSPLSFFLSVHPLSPLTLSKITLKNNNRE